MAQAKELKPIERTYNIPLRKEFLKVAGWRRTEKAVTAAREFLGKHMKSEDVKLSKDLNEKLWEHGIRNPPHHVKVIVTRDEKGVVRAKLFGETERVTSAEKKAAKKTTTKAPAAKTQKSKEAPKA